MRQCLYDIDSKGNLTLASEAMKIVPALSYCRQEDMRFVILAYDYLHGPFLEMPKDARIAMAINMIYKGKKSREELEYDLQGIINIYCSLIYEIDYETRDALRTKIAQLIQKIRELNMNDEDDVKRLQSYDKALKILRAQYDEYDTRIRKEEEKLELKGNKTESFIETLRRRRRLYELANNVNVKQEWIDAAGGD